MESKPKILKADEMKTVQGGICAKTDNGCIYLPPPVQPPAGIPYGGTNLIVDGIVYSV